ncbi:tetratricopeptide repeat protein [Sporobolomyces salmoneus]|uniref:tetratricopeptide repeat protein n=1 Tax=Sporobolomyces salmoneus TaxID=183962 RepID=UPI00316CEA78
MSLSEFPIGPLSFPLPVTPPRNSPSSSSSQFIFPPPSPNSRVRQSTARQSFEEAKALYETGIIISKENPAAGIAHFIQAARVFGDLGPGQSKRREKAYWQAGICSGRVGWIAKKRKDWNDAKQAFEQALEIFRTIKDSEKEATTLYQLSLVSSDILAASDYLKKASLMYSELNNGAKEAMCLSELGNLFGKREKDISTSLLYWKQALLLYIKMGDREKEARALFSIAEILVRSAERSTAFKYFLQARTIFRSIPNRMKKWDGDCSYQLGKICVGEKRFQAAVEYFEEASASFREVELWTDEAWSLYRLALDMLKVHSKDLAIDYLTEARRLFAEVGNQREAEGSCLLRLAEISKTSDPERAKDLLNEALEFVDPAKERRLARRSTLILQSLSQYPDAGAPMHKLDRQLQEEDWSLAAATEGGGGGELELERIREEDEYEYELEQASGTVEQEAVEDERDRRCRQRDGEGRKEREQRVGRGHLGGKG